MLKEAGVENVYNMEGGIRAWEGLVAEGPPDSGAAHFPEDASREELIWLAWQLEDGSRRFYASLSEVVDDTQARDLFRRLKNAEEHHSKSLESLLEQSAANPFSTDEDIMEGGMRISSALAWATGKSVTAVLELMLSLETNAYDLYLRMLSRFESGKHAEVFSMLAGEEKQHLKRLAELLEQKI